MQVSVVIPCYNASAFAPAAVGSTLNQSVPVREVIVVDDGSTDDLAGALSVFDDARLQIVTTPNRGVAHARNLGAELAGGDLVGFLDADDTWYPDKLQVQLGQFDVNPRPVAVGSRMHHVGKRGPVAMTGESVLDDDARPRLLAGRLMPFAVSSALFDLARFREVGGFDESLRQAEDLDLVARIAALGPIVTVAEPLGAYRVHADSASARDYRAQREATRFVRARLAARNAGGDLTWTEFRAAAYVGVAAREWLDDTARSLYRTAGLLAADGHYVGAAWHLGGSIVMRPSYALHRLRQQRVREQLRGGGHG